MKKYYKLGKEEVFLTTGIYMTTSNTSVYATCINGEPYCTLTVNFDKLEGPELVYLNVNLSGINVEKFFVKNGLAVKVEGKKLKSGYVEYPLYRLNLKKIQGDVRNYTAAELLAVKTGIEVMKRYLEANSKM